MGTEGEGLQKGKETGGWPAGTQRWGQPGWAAPEQGPAGR